MFDPSLAFEERWALAENLVRPALGQAEAS